MCSAWADRSSCHRHEWQSSPNAKRGRGAAVGGAGDRHVRHRESTVLAELKRRGHRVVDTDDPGWIVETNTAGGFEPAWDLDRIRALIDSHRTGWLFISGCVANQGAVYNRLDAVVLLSAPVDVILDRVADRANPFGSTAEDRTKIANDLAVVEPLLRASADREIVTTAPISEIISALEQIASVVEHREAPGSRHEHRN